MADPVFSEPFRQQLAQGKYTDWAAALTEEEVRCVLWLVGEFNARAFGIMGVLKAAEAELKTSSRAVQALEALTRVATYGEHLTVNTWAQSLQQR
jgi:hypothetical protein